MSTTLALALALALAPQATAPAGRGRIAEAERLAAGGDAARPAGSRGGARPGPPRARGDGGVRAHRLRGRGAQGRGGGGRVPGRAGRVPAAPGGAVRGGGDRPGAAGERPRGEPLPAAHVPARPDARPRPGPRALAERARARARGDRHRPARDRRPHGIEARGGGGDRPGRGRGGAAERAGRDRPRAPRGDAGQGGRAARGAARDSPGGAPVDEPGVPPRRGRPHRLLRLRGLLPQLLVRPRGAGAAGARGTCA